MNPNQKHRPAGGDCCCGSDVSRRDFIKAGTLAGVVAGGSLGAFYFGYGRVAGAPVRVGVIGTGDQGGVLLGAINPQYIEVRSIADLRPYNIYRALHGDHASPADAALRPGLMAKHGWKTEEEARRHVKVYNEANGGYEGLVKNAKADGIEAVIIALPLHQHAKAAMAAMAAGLHVFTERLMAGTVLDCKKMARAATEARVYLAVGHQRHYNILYANAVDTLRRGTLGELHYIRAQCHRGAVLGKDPWIAALPEGTKSDDPLNGKLSKDLEGYLKKVAAAKDKKNANAKDLHLWSMLAAQKKAQICDEAVKDKVKDFGYADLEALVRWRLWKASGVGLMALTAGDQLDAAHMFIAAAHRGEEQLPLNVVGAGNRPLATGAGQIPRDLEDHVYCIMEYPAPGYNPDDSIAARKKIGVQYAVVNGNDFGGYGEILYGKSGTYILANEKEWSIVKGGAPTSVKTSGAGPSLNTQASGAQGAVSKTKENVSPGYTEELEHWAYCIRHPRAANQPYCGPVAGVTNAVIALTANLAAQQSRRIEFRKEWFDIASDETPEAAKA